MNATQALNERRAAEIALRGAGHFDAANTMRESADAIERGDWDGVFSWLWENDQNALEDHDDQGAYPEPEEVEAALDALGYLQPEETEEDEES